MRGERETSRGVGCWLVVLLEGLLQQPRLGGDLIAESTQVMTLGEGGRTIRILICKMGKRKKSRR